MLLHYLKQYLPCQTIYKIILFSYKKKNIYKFMVMISSALSPPEKCMNLYQKWHLNRFLMHLWGLWLFCQGLFKIYVMIKIIWILLIGMNNASALWQQWERTSLNLKNKSPQVGMETW